MRTELLDYDLPPDRIASRPTPERDGARMLEVGASALHDRSVREFPERVPAEAVLVLNDTRVFPARLLGQKRTTGGRVELLLLRPLDGSEDSVARDPDEQRWRTLARPARGLRAGTELTFGDALAGVALGAAEDGEYDVLLRAPGGVRAAIERVGHVPIPPYLARADDAADKERYQTTFARASGSVAAPTAGLHLTDAGLARLASRGVEVVTLTLHVGVGTFRPVTADDLTDHVMHTESLEISDATASAVEAARATGRPVIAVGTTVVRALEAAALGGAVEPGRRETALLLQPGSEFRVVTGLLTNFHMPRSTLLALVAAFAGLERVRAAYDHALAAGYRFLSYGDAMWLPERLA